MIERQFHDLREGQRPGGELFTENLGQGRHAEGGKELARIVKDG
jgi:hypothetical protein